jgi:hypothetical protein
MSADTILARQEQHTWLEQWLPHLRTELEALEPDDCTRRVRWWGKVSGRRRNS